MPANVLTPEQVAILEKEAFDRMESAAGAGAGAGGAGVSGFGGSYAEPGAGGASAPASGAGAGAGSGVGAGAAAADHSSAIAKLRALPPSHCMHVSNINPLDTTASRVFNVACCFGNVDFVEFRPPKSDGTSAGLGGATAVVHFEKPELAAQAVALLDGVMVMGWRWATKLGEPGDSAEGPEGPLPDGGERSVFKDSMHNRFRSAGKEDTITAPTPVLYFSNMPATMDESKIMELLNSIAP